jgi:hypothetical protein
LIYQFGIFENLLGLIGMKFIKEKHELVICGGGLAGVCAAIAAARLGTKTCIIQDRPVFGGNSSSEIRVTPHGAAQFHGYARETGIISEFLIEERARNHERIFENGWTNSIWDLVLYDRVMQTPNLSSYLNTSITAVEKANHHEIRAVVARVLNAETEIKFYGHIFIDCTGDSIVADLAGCEWRMGSEAKSEFNEYHAPTHASSDVMGSSLFFRARDFGFPVPFTPPEWAARYDDSDFFYGQGRIPYDLRGGFWWIEIGIPWNTITDNEEIRIELTKHALGVWDWIKNKDPKTKELATNYGLDWIGQVPGKRESRRVIGRYLMNENDIKNKTVFPDEVAYGGWFLDLHTPGGLSASSSEPCSAENYAEMSEYAAASYCGPYGIPLRILLSKDINNLMMAGRNISATHAALGSLRVMGTTSLMGQAAGTAAALILSKGKTLDEFSSKTVQAIQQQLLRDGCFLPNNKNEDPLDLAPSASIAASSEDRLVGLDYEDENWYQGLKSWREESINEDQIKQEGETFDPNLLLYRMGQWIAIGSERKIKSLKVCLSNHSNERQLVECELKHVEHIWDYRSEPKTLLSSSVLSVPPGKFHWIEWKIDLDKNTGLIADRYVRLDLLPNPKIEWHIADAIETGHFAAYEISPGHMRRLGKGLGLSYEIDPPQSCFSPKLVVSGVTRPYRSTNIWRSDRKQAFPQWLELRWEKKQRISTIELTFPGYVEREYHAYPPFYRDPQCAEAYSIEARIDKQWHGILHITNNYQRHRRHSLRSPIETDAVRIIIRATNGDSSAGIFEVRCY